MAADFVLVVGKSERSGVEGRGEGERGGEGGESCRRNARVCKIVNVASIKRQAF